MSPLLKLVQVSLDGTPSSYCVTCTAQLCVICKLAEDAHDPTVSVMDKDVEEPSVPGQTSLVTILHLDTEPLATTLWLCPSS